MENNRPRGREKNVTGPGKDVYKRGEGLGTGPVGSTGGQGRKNDRQEEQKDRPTRAGGRGSPLVGIILAALVLLGGGGLGLGGLFGGGDTTTGTSYSGTGAQSSSFSQSGSSGSAGSVNLSSLLGSFGGVSSGWSHTANTGRLNTSVASGARAKRTAILGGGQDSVTIMVYLCGTDLESKYGMATSDLQEMCAASLSDKVNIIAFTGGCKQWKNDTISSTVNQIYKVERGGIRVLERDAGTSAMTSPANLTSFIRYCAQNYPANRNELIFWDHGGGSLSGYGYDEKNASSGSMSLAGINRALKDAGVTFDFIGFDACLMATLENALMLTDYADYLIASEETEPGVGWYYTNWLTKLSQNTSMPTVEIGRNIIDDFVSVCDQKCAGQKTTLSIVDLAELEATIPARFSDFARDTSALIQGSQYQTVSTARSQAREFAQSSKIDQVDLVHLAYNLGSDEGEALADALLSAVKYNKTSSSITDAYGLSIYFPYQRTNKVSSAVDTYEAIGMDDAYSDCIRRFASLGTAGQAVSASSSTYAGNPLAALMGSASGGSAGSEVISELLGSLLTGTLSGRAMDLEGAEDYLAENQFDSAQLVWLGDSPEIQLSAEQWALVNDLELNVFYDDGEGYIDLGLDNVFAFSDAGALLGEYDGTWLAIDRQPVPYYHLSTVDEGEQYTITGYVPCLLNGERAELLLSFDQDNPYGSIVGARSVYAQGETETQPKSLSLTELSEGDEIDFVCDYYGYDGSYQDSYLFGDPWVYHEGAEISNVVIDADAANASIRFTDIYGQHFWTETIPQGS